MLSRFKISKSGLNRGCTLRNLAGKKHFLIEFSKDLFFHCSFFKKKFRFAVKSIVNLLFRNILAESFARFPLDFKIILTQKTFAARISNWWRKHSTFSTGELIIFINSRERKLGGGEGAGGWSKSEFIRILSSFWKVWVIMHSPSPPPGESTYIYVYE